MTYYENEYIITGETKEHGECLVYVCGTSRGNAEKVLHRMLNNPNSNDIIVMKGHTNFRIREIEAKNCWWNQGGLD